MIVKGQPADPDKRYGVRVDDSGATVVEADEYKGLWNYASCEKLFEGEDSPHPWSALAPPARCA